MKNANYQNPYNFYHPHLFENQFPEDIDTDYENSIETGGNTSLFIARPKILLVEDNFMLQTVFSDMLSFLGCKVDVAEDGYEAVDMANQQTYDVIFMDIGLPRLDGVSATKAIRNQEPSQYRNIIVALTAHGDAVAKECEDAGINDFYTKPILIDELMRILTYWLPHLLAPNNSH